MPARAQATAHARSRYKKGVGLSEEASHFGPAHAVPKKELATSVTKNSTCKMVYKYLLLLTALVAACTAITVPVQSQTSKGKRLQ